MKTIILPGFSIKNKDWAYAVKYNLADLDQEIIVHEWFHWITEHDDDFDAEQEVARLNIKEPINIIAKSVGTFVAVSMLQKNTDNKVNKIILNGIPLNDLEKEDFDAYEVLKSYDLEKCLFIQNKNDPHASFQKVKKFLKKINKNIKVISKPRADHEYPFWDEFREFLTS